MRLLQKALDRVLQTFCVVLFAAMVLLVSWQVFTRLVLQHPSAWSEEAAKYVFVWLGLMGVAYVIGEKDDVAIDFLVRKLPAAFAKSVELLVHLVILFFAAWVMIWGGSSSSQLAWDQTIPSLPLHQGWVYLAVPISGTLIALYTIIHIVQLITGSTPAHPADVDGLTLPPEESI